VRPRGHRVAGGDAPILDAEDEVAGELGYDYEALRGSVDRLVAMHGDVATLRAQLAARMTSAGPESWPDIPGVQTFAARYSEALRNTQERIETIETALDEARTALAESARAIQNVDAAQQTELERIAGQLDGLPQFTRTQLSPRISQSIA
jgi:predicted RNase H-like HicB family nuclease